MKTRFLALLTVGLTTLFAAGCYSSVDGRMRAGMPLSKDEIENRYERPVSQVFAVARDVLSRNGTLTSENTISQTIEAKIDRNTVWVRVDEVESQVSRVIVQARKRGGGGNVDLASEIATQIGIGLATVR